MAAAAPGARPELDASVGGRCQSATFNPVRRRSRACGRRAIEHSREASQSIQRAAIVRPIALVHHTGVQTPGTTRRQAARWKAARLRPGQTFRPVQAKQPGVPIASRPQFRVDRSLISPRLGRTCCEPPRSPHLTRRAIASLAARGIRPGTTTGAGARSEPEPSRSIAPMGVPPDPERDKA